MIVLYAGSWWHTSRDPLASNQWLVTLLQISREKLLIMFLSPKDHIDRRRCSNV